jgi:hypothetical protein
MEHLRQPEGDRNEITTNDQAAPDAAATLPLTFAGEGKRPEASAHHLAELALSAAVVAWWSRWQPIAMHRAFLNGASLAEVAMAVGVTGAEAYDPWSAWAEGQMQLWHDSGLGVNPDEADAIRTCLGQPVPKGADQLSQ